MPVVARSVDWERLLVITPRDIKSENVDMSNEKSFEKHDPLPVIGSLPWTKILERRE